MLIQGDTSRLARFIDQVAFLLGFDFFEGYGNFSVTG